MKKISARNRVALAAIGMAVLLCSSVFADIERTWKTHSACSDNVSSLSTAATSLLQSDDTSPTQDDVSVCVTIKKGATDTGWTFTGDVDNDGKVLSTAEESAFHTAAAAAGKNSFRLVRWKPGATEATGFYTSSYGIAIMNGGNANTLAHEIGHVAGLSDLSTPTHRIMYGTSSDTKNTVSSSEKTSYEAL